MATEKYLDGDGTLRYRKSTGDGSSAASGSVLHQIIDSGTVSITGSVAVTGTFWQTTQPVSIASTVTVTGTGGTFPVTDSGGSLTVDNGGTFAVQAAQSGTWTVQPGNTANTTAWLVTGTGGSFPVTDSGGSLTVDAPVGTPVFVRLSDGSSAITTLPVSLASVPSHPVTNAGTFAVQVSSALPAGTNNIGDVDILSIAAGSNVIGDVGLSGRTTGGLTLHSRISTGTDATNVKNAAGQVFWAFVTNTNASARYIKFYNSASAPTLGSGTPVLRFLIPPGSSGLQLTAEQGLAFSAGIGYTLSTGAADADTGAVAASEIVVNIGYR